jgi:hypothetical protein
MQFWRRWRVSEPDNYTKEECEAGIDAAYKHLDDRAKAEARAREWRQSKDEVDSAVAGMQPRFDQLVADLILTVQEEAKEEGILLGSAWVPNIEDRNAEVKRVVEEVRGIWEATPAERSTSGLVCDEILRRLEADDA